MIAKQLEQPRQTEMRTVLMDTLLASMQQNKDVVYLDADLAGAIGSTKLLSALPAQAFNVGIMEANMAGVAAGMSVNGKIPFIHSFGVFATRRVADQVFISGCYNRANVKILGSDCGVAAETNGGTHMPLEDVSIFRSYPDMTILDIADTTLMRRMIPAVIEHDGMVYMRFPRKKVADYYSEDNSFAIGKGMMLREGRDVTIIAAGLEVDEALQASAILKGMNISTRVVDMFTLKPVDTELIVDCAKRTGAVVTAENHNVIGGLGSAVAEVLVENAPVPMQRVGVNEQFGEVGTRQYLAQKFRLTKDDIVNAALEAVKRKHYNA